MAQQGRLACLPGACHQDSGKLSRHAAEQRFGMSRNPHAYIMHLLCTLCNLDLYSVLSCTPCQSPSTQVPSPVRKGGLRGSF